MNARLFAPFAGFVVSFPFFSGFTSSSSSPKLPDNSIPTDSSWSPQTIESFAVSYKCGESYDMKDLSFGTFKVTMDKSELNGKEKELKDNKEVKAGIGFNFEVSGDRGKLSKLGGGGERKAYMTVFSRWDSGLRILLQENKFNYGRDSDVTLYCQIDTSLGDREARTVWREDEIFKGDVKLGESQKPLSLEGWKGTTYVSVAGCSDGVDGTKTCDFKLTDTSRWKWSVRVAKKLNFKLSKWGLKK